MPIVVTALTSIVMITTTSGCDDVVRTVPAPSRETFRETVYPVLLRDCAFSGCHGDPRRPLFVAGPGRVRLAAEMDLYEPPTAEEVDRAYDRARALLLAEGDEPPPLVHKPGPTAAHAGRDAAGDNLYMDAEEPALLALRAWAEGM